MGIRISCIFTLSLTNKDRKMENLETLKEQVRLAKTANSEGRQLIANSCKELYNIIEEDLYNKYGEAAVNDAYKDLCNGDFAEPFLCEKMKEKFELYANILPKK